MCTGAEFLVFAQSAAAVAGTAAAINSMSQKTPTPMTPEKPPQQSKGGSYDAFKRTNAAAAIGAGGGQSSTMLTGVGGVSDSALNLGKNTLLGQ